MLRGGAVGAAGLAGAALIGCSDDDDPTATPDAGGGGGATATTAPTAAPTEAPPEDTKRGGTLIVETGNPVPAAFFGAFNPGNDYIQDTVWETLTERGKDFLPSPLLAETVEFNDDFTGAQIRVKPGVEFHNGKPLTAEVVRDSINMYRSDEITSQLKNPLLQIESMNVADERTLELTFATSFPALMDTFNTLPIIDVDTFPNVADVTPDVVVGTGPFVLKDFVPDISYALERNENYHQDGRPYVDALDGKIFSDEEARILALQTGEIQVNNNASYAMVKRLEGVDGVKTIDLGKGGMWYIGLVVDVPPLDDLRVRQALIVGVDRQRLAEEWAEGVIGPQALPWPAGAPGFVDEDEALAAYDPERAKALIKEAGAEGAKIKFTIGNRSPRPEIAQFVQDDLKLIGLDVELEIVEYSIYLAALRGREIPTGGWISSHGFSGSIHPATLLNSAQQYRVPNPSHYEEPDFADLIARMNAIDPSTAEGVAVLREFNQRYLRDDPWLVPLAANNSFRAMRDNIMGTEPDGGLTPRIQEWWIA